MNAATSISCALPPGPDTPHHIELAERLGYERAWLYDSSAMYFDPWMTLALAAQRTSRIGLAIGVCVPALRNVTVTASALLTVHHVAPGRITFGIGAGGTGMLMLGKRPNRWADVIAYADAVRALLRGETVEWDGAPVRLTHQEGVSFPIEIPVVFGAEGPRGEAAAHEHADGISTVWHTPTQPCSWICRIVFGTVLDDGEAATSDRAFQAAGPGVAPAYHYAYTAGDRAMLEQLPGGSEWAAQADQLPEAGRHLSVWEGHCVRLNDIDQTGLPREAIPAMSLTGSAAEVRARLAPLQEACTEIVYQPSGPDIARELSAFADAVLGNVVAA